MDDMMGPSSGNIIPTAMNNMGGLLTHQNAAAAGTAADAAKLLQLPKSEAATSFGALMENDQNFLQGMLMNNDSNHQFVSSSAGNNNGNIIGSNNNAMSNTLVPLKRPLPGLFWNVDDDDNEAAAGQSTSSKRLHLDNGTADVGISAARTTSSNDGNGTNSITTLLSQLPQSSTSPSSTLRHQAMLGSLGDGLFIAPYNSLPSMNWY